MKTSLVEDFYFDDVALPCPRCESLDITVYSFTDESSSNIVEGHCANCQSRWYID